MIYSNSNKLTRHSANLGKRHYLGNELAIGPEWNVIFPLVTFTAQSLKSYPYRKGHRITIKV